MRQGYRWAYPLNWLEDKLNGTSDPDVLRDFALTMARRMDSDMLQDLFQYDMYKDGFFEQNSRTTHS